MSAPQYRALLAPYHTLPRIMLDHDGAEQYPVMTVHQHRQIESLLNHKVDAWIVSERCFNAFVLELKKRFEH